MPIHLIIDGYNMIGFTDGLGGDLENSRRLLIDRLSQYRRSRGHAVTVVFDGTRGGGFMEEAFRRAGVDIVFSRAGQTADDFIKRMAEREGSRCIVISSDREVQVAARSRGAVAIDVQEFEARLRAAPSEGSVETQNDEEDERVCSSKKGNPRKLSKAERQKRNRLRRV